MKIQKVFLISFHKAGTRSFHRFMCDHGYSSIHYPHVFEGRRFEEEIAPFRGDPAAVVQHLKPVIDAADAHSDVPWPGLYRELLHEYPRAKFVLGTRDPESWANSVAHHWSLNYLPRRLNNYEYCQYAPYLGSAADRPIDKSDKALLIKALLDHEAEARRSIAPEQLFVFKLGDKDTGPRLAEFLGFNHLHDMKRMGDRKKTQFQRLRRRLMKRLWRVAGVAKKGK